MRKFSVVLKPPPGSDQNGATLRFRMYISPDQINRLGPITLSADVNGQQLEPQTFTKAGDNIYSRPVPAEALKDAEVKVNFSLDKARDPRRCRRAPAWCGSIADRSSTPVDGPPMKLPSFLGIRGALRLRIII